MFKVLKFIVISVVCLIIMGASVLYGFSSLFAPPNMDETLIPDAASQFYDINNDEIVKSLIVDLTMNEDDSPNFSATRIKRINTLHDEFLKKKIDGKTVKDLINNTSVNEEIPKTNLPVDSIDDEWDGLTFMNFEKAYDAKEDILNILNSLSDKSIPIAVRNVDISDINFL